MSDEVLVSVENVRKKFCRRLRRSLWYGMQDMAREAMGSNGHHDQLRKDEFWAVNDVSFELRRGECLGLIGRNGAGKTTLLKMLTGLIKPDHGRIKMRGRVGALIALGAGFNPVLTGRENVYVNGSVLGLTKREISEKIDEIIDFAEIREFIDSPVQSYSSGMQVRLGFAVASSLNPDVLILDEVLAVGDAGFRVKCYNRIYDICRQAAIIFVSHNMPHISRLCSKAIVLSGGSAKFIGETGPAIEQYNHLFVTKGYPWQITNGVKIHSLKVNGDAKTTSLKICGKDSIEIEIDAEFPKSATDLEVSISLLTESFDLISHGNSSFEGSKLINPQCRCILSAFAHSAMLGSGTKYLSIMVRNASTSEILFWANGGWRLIVNNPQYIPSPAYLVSSYSLSSKNTRNDA